VLRIMPRLHDDVNEEWISDKSRFVWDGLGRQRLDRKIGVIAGDMNDVEGLYAAKELFDALGVKSIDARQDGSKLGAGPRESYLFNSTIKGIDQADAILIVGANPRVEAAVMNARIRQRWLTGKCEIGVIGEAHDLTYDYAHVGEGAKDLAALGGKRSGFIKTLKDAERPMIILGAGALAREDGAQVMRAAGELADKIGAVKDGWNGFNVLHTAASRVGALDLGFVPGEGGRDTNAILEGAASGDVDTVVLLGADEIDMAKLGSAFVIYVGHHGDKGAQRADLVLPSAAYTEKPGLYVNTEGRVQMAERAVFPKGEAKEDWAIFRALSARLGKTLPYNDLNALRAKLIGDHEILGQIDHAPGALTATEFKPAELGEAGDVSDAPFKSPVTDFYFTNSIARASKTMAECSAAATTARQTLQAAE
jgi:NADH-quinone oxidoreductase subunit G